ncbi:ferrochelatase [Radiomyces spectabilis]|uniref:ferrochelatase n=1 Tax=Radiomyces spectabilis TaxID=64574 RepID=UPI00221FDB53|nr:ferrochelatase [Radiomyces spectabilis]KAI8390968.1 ferrochelatase [Radiomyces spectabilis]
MSFQYLLRSLAGTRAVLKSAHPTTPFTWQPARSLATSTNTIKKPPTAVLLTNMGGPETLDDVHDFLHNLFSDRDIMQLPWQKQLAKIIAKRRSPSIREQYAEIGGGSPILRWTRAQGQAMEKLLDEISPETAPHKHYIAFRYVEPYTDTALQQMKEDGVKRAVVFTQYPQYSCSTTGSSLNELQRGIDRAGLTDQIQWSIIDRWPTHPGFVEAMAVKIERKLAEYTAEERRDAIILFSAHSLPMQVVNRGDPYPAEVAASVQRVMERLGNQNAYRLVWQSQVGPKAWLGPQTSDALEGYAKAGKKNIVVVPIAFTSDHIETLYELDHEYGAEAKKAGVTGWKRAEALNDDPVFVKAMADIVKEHLQKNESASKQWYLRCPGCTTDACQTTRDFFPYKILDNKA